MEEALRRVKGLKTPEKVASPKKSKTASPAAKSPSRTKDKPANEKALSLTAGKGPSVAKSRKRRGQPEPEEPSTSGAVTEAQPNSTANDVSLIARR